MRIEKIEVWSVGQPMIALHRQRCQGNLEIAIVEIESNSVVGYGSARAHGGTSGRLVCEYVSTTLTALCRGMRSAMGGAGGAAMSRRPADPAPGPLEAYCLQLDACFRTVSQITAFRRYLERSCSRTNATRR